MTPHQIGTSSSTLFRWTGGALSLAIPRSRNTAPDVDRNLLLDDQVASCVTLIRCMHDSEETP